MQVQIAFRQYNNKKTYLVELHFALLHVPAYIYIFFIEIACFDFNDCHIIKCINVCVHMHGHTSIHVCVCMHACMGL